MSDDVDPRTAIAATFARMRAELDEAERRALALLAQPAPVLADDTITMGQAAALLQRTAETATKLVIARGLGVKVGGRWYVSRGRCLALREGRPYEPLAPADDQIR